MKIKEGANIQGLDIRMRPVLIVADRLWNLSGQELVITCGLNGNHSASSLHYYGRAVDLRTRYFDDNVKKKIIKDMTRILGYSYDVVSHKSHIHVEYDIG